LLPRAPPLARSACTLGRHGTHRPARWLPCCHTRRRCPCRHDAALLCCRLGSQCWRVGGGGGGGRQGLSGVGGLRYRPPVLLPEVAALPAERSPVQRDLPRLLHGSRQTPRACRSVSAPGMVHHPVHAAVLIPASGRQAGRGRQWRGHRQSKAPVACVAQHLRAGQCHPPCQRWQRQVSRLEVGLCHRECVIRSCKREGYSWPQRRPLSARCSASGRFWMVLDIIP
jgi:hypothetical protein